MNKYPDDMMQEDIQVPLSKCFFLFSLRQGTILTGLIVLMVSSGCLFVLVVCSAHAHEMAAMLEADMADTAHREGIVLAEFSDRGSMSGPLSVSSAEARSHTDLILTKAHHMAVLVVVWLYLGVGLATVHLVFCLLLLYGTIMRVRQLLVPWLCIAMVGLVISCTGALVSVFLLRGYAAFTIFLLSTISICLGFYLWLIVYCHYLELVDLKAALSDVTQHTYKEGYMSLIEKPSSV